MDWQGLLVFCDSSYLYHLIISRIYYFKLHCETGSKTRALTLGSVRSKPDAIETVNDGIALREKTRIRVEFGDIWNRESGECLTELASEIPPTKQTSTPTHLLCRQRDASLITNRGNRYLDHDFFSIHSCVLPSHGSSLVLWIWITPNVAI